MSEHLNHLWAVPDLVLLGDGAQYNFLSWLIPQGNWEDWKKQSVQIKYAVRFSKERTPGSWLISTPKLLPHMNIYIPAEGEEWSDLTHTGARFAVFEMFPFGKDETRMLLSELEAANSAPEVLLVLVKLPLHTGATDLHSDEDECRKVMAAYLAQGRAVMVIQERREDIIHVLHWHEPLRDYTVRALKRETERLRKRHPGLKWDYDGCLEDWNSENGFLDPKSMKRVTEFKSVQKNRASNIWDCYAEEMKKMLFPSGHKGGLFDMVDRYAECFEGGIWNCIPFPNDRELLLRRMESTLALQLKEHRVEVGKSAPFTEENYVRVVDHYKIIEKFQKCISQFIKNDVLRLSQELLLERCGQLEKVYSEYIQKRC